MWMGLDEQIGFYVPKGHQFAHMLAFFWIFAPADAAQLNNFEFEHIKHVKDAPKQTVLRGRCWKSPRLWLIESTQ